MKKIKSVKLKNDYRSMDSVILKGTVGLKDTPHEYYMFGDREIEPYIYVSINSILNNKTDLFEIEYEEERKYIDVRIEYSDDEIIFPFNTKLIEEVLKKEFFQSRKIEVLELGRGTK